jgi:bifunctional oligoribonuclease and PAP phosphatase NrnA
MSFLIKRQIKEQIDAATRILLLTDDKIDGDTIGSTLGMYHVLSTAGKEVDVYSPHPLPDVFEFLPGVEMIQRQDGFFKDADYDLVLIFDCADGGYIKPLLPLMLGKPAVIVFDHHATNPKYGDLNLIEPVAASTADVVWRFLREMKFEIDRSAAQCILTGICTDTDTFSTSNTTAACLEAAHELSKLGAKLQVIVRNTMMNKSVSALKLWGLALERLHHNDEFDALCTAICLRDLKKLGAQKDDLQGLSNFLNAMVQDADMIVVLYERTDGSVKGSMRARDRDVSKIAAKRGGGGHKRAAGFSVEGAHLEEKDGQWFIVK